MGENLATDYIDQFRNDKAYLDVFRRRVRQELPEMDSCRDVAEIVASLSGEIQGAQTSTILDIPCATGYLYYSLAARMSGFTYTGVDILDQNISEAQRVFNANGQVDFHVADLHDFKCDPYDIVVCANTLYNFPNAALALERLAGMTKKYLLVRALVGEVSLYIRMSHDDVFDSQGVPGGHWYYSNIYTESYLFGVLKGLGFKSVESIEPGPASADLAAHNSNAFKSERKGMTRISNGQQIAGNLVLDWRTIVARF